MRIAPLVRVGLIGAATGCRSQSGIAALALTQPGTPNRGLSRILGGARGRALYASGAVGELVVDKLPKTPSRLEPAGVASRLGFGALAGAMLGERLESNVAVAAALGAAASVATTYGGAWWRRTSSRRFRKDLPGALVEDLVAANLARLAVTDA
jgi:uncharacterized membrane protein